MNILSQALKRLLTPLVRILLRHGMSFDEFVEVAKRTYVEVADREFTLEGRKQTIARVAMLTGIQRKEVSRLKQQIGEEAIDLDSAYNRGVRITSGWRRDPVFSAAGRPLPLSLEGEVSFSALVKRYSGDLPVRAVLDELRRTGVIERRQDQVVLVNDAGYVPSAAEEEQLNILGIAAADLLNTLAYNLQPGNENKQLQLQVSYDNLPLAAVNEFDAMARSEGFALLKQFDEWLATQDRDANPEVPDGDRHRAGVGIYFFHQSPDR